jgi:hypothetical protein
VRRVSEAIYGVPLSPGHPHWPAVRAGMASAHTDVTRHGGRPVALMLAPRDGWWLLGYAWASRTPVHLVELVLEATEP